MDEVFTNFYSKISKFNVSRETCSQFENLISMISEKNKKINLISRRNDEKNLIRDRHIVDSIQVIDFVDLNSNTTSDLGSGSGMPGLVIAILMKSFKKGMKINLYEKSYHKCAFLEEASKKLKLNTEIIHKDLFKVKNLKTGTIVTRAFKPMPTILELVNNNFTKYKNLILFMGSSGRRILKDTLKNWELDYEERKSITNKDAFLLNIKKIKKKLV